MDGNTFAALVRDVWTPELITTVFANHWVFGGQFDAPATPGGSMITTGYEYAISSNVGTYNYDDAMVEPYTSNQVKAFFNKDSYQEAARLFNVYLDYMNNGGTEPDFDAIKASLATGTSNLVDKMSTTMIADMEAQIDASAAYSDAALSRTTYPSLKSYEEDTGTALTLAHLEDAIEALMTHTTYGAGVKSQNDLQIYLPRNQLTNLGRLATGASNFGLNTETQNMGPMDAGKVFRIQSFEGIGVEVVPEMTATTILIVHKPDIKLYKGREITWVSKDEKSDTQLWQGTSGYNLIVHSPGNSAKLSNKTA